MNPQHQLQARLTILKILAECNGYLLSEIQLFSQLNLEIKPPVTIVEMESELKFLESDRLIAGINPALGGPRKWQITDLGKLARAEA